MFRDDGLAENATPPLAVVMNLFYTGLGIARSLGEKGVPVIGLTAKRGVYGNFTRYAKVLSSPDSRTEGPALLKFLLELARGFAGPAVIFPTRDDDLVFLDRFRSELAPHYSAVAPESPALKTCLDKWHTYLAAQDAEVPVPRCWIVARQSDVAQVLQEVTYPCVLKPVCAHHWRQGVNWELVGARKAVAVSSEDEFLSEYPAVARADERVLVQELIPGGDEALVVTACYLDRNRNWAAAFNAQKLLQVPSGFGTGCIVQAVDCATLFEPTRRLLERIGYSGIAEVEYKWDAASNTYKLIEVNPRPWDQHRLGQSCGVDLIYLAYCDHAGLPAPSVNPRVSGQKWIAEDTFLTAGLRSFWKRDPVLRSMFKMARGGRKVYAIWSWKDPVPFLYFFATVGPQIVAGVVRKLATGVIPRRSTEGAGAERRFDHERQCKNASSKVS